MRPGLLPQEASLACHMVPFKILEHFAGFLCSCILFYALGERRVMTAELDQQPEEKEKMQRKRGTPSPAATAVSQGGL